MNAVDEEIKEEEDNKKGNKAGGWDNEQLELLLKGAEENDEIDEANNEDQEEAS